MRVSTIGLGKDCNSFNMRKISNAGRGICTSISSQGMVVDNTVRVLL